ncbi:molecular chaperone [Alcanivorax sp. HI0083]|uniref:DMT family transporter n=1 Tax=unclassified Alcanivorax TaxID=2638842 RepID=UPI0007B7C977|nr:MULTISPECIES: multidrug efflux SMR transporter [unclassified Alcanivorax]KZY36444.1 molecular chaperone [Alcanivorax sp. HI0044]KZY38455.1 molecular chaperone [Alcanivorax sp. HI0044]KZZ26057.1 molecular chaperone [Alcanivorax sp. HI0083]
MAWALVILAGIIETGWALGLKSSHGFTRPLPSLLTLIGMIASFWLLAKAMQTLPVGTAYAVWTGIGTVGTVLLGILLFQDAVNAPRLLCLGLILVGIVGLKIFSP